ncbi:MAG: ribonuclease R, partial [Leeuwenhoekiella sp.]
MPRNKRRNSSTTKESLSQRVLGILKSEPGKPFNHKQIAATLGLDDPSSRNEIVKLLSQLRAKDQIEEIERGKYIFNDVKQYHTGILDMSSRGGGYVMVEGMEQDIYVPSNNLNKALHGDEVKVYIYKQRRSKKHEGEIVEILHRKNTEFVGVINIQKSFAFVNTSSEGKMHTDIFVPLKKIGEAKDGEKVLVRMDDWPEKADSPFGTVLKVLGMPGEHNTEIHSILAQYGLPHDFPAEIEEFANQIDTSIKADEIKKRRDMRDVL